MGGWDFFFNETATTEIYTLSLHDALPIFRDTWVTICSYEAHKAHAVTYPSRANEYGEYFREFLRSGSEVSDSDYNAAGSERRRLNRIFETELSKVDAVVCPSGGVPFEIASGSQYGGMDAISPVLSSILPHNSMPADLDRKSVV